MGNRLPHRVRAACGRRALLRGMWASGGLATERDGTALRRRAARDRHGVLLIGYSFGADVLPFLYRRLPEPTRASVRSVTLLAPSTHADFEFHLSDWLPGPSGPGAATRPEIERMGAARVLCLHPSEEGESPCDGARLPGLATLSLDGGHHFNGDYAGLAARILEFARKVPRAAPRH